MEKAETFFLGFILFFIAIAARGLTVLVGWNEIVVKIFTSMPVLDFIQALALGIVFVVFAATSQANQNKDKPFADKAIGSIMFNGLAIGLFYLLSLFI